jgi:hypothetical protein
MNLFQPLPGIERVSPVKACGLDVESTQGLSGRPYNPSRTLSKPHIQPRGRTPSTAAGGPPPSKREVLGFRRSKPAALPSIGYRVFAVAPMTLRAPSRNIVVITVTGAAIYETGAQCAPLRGTAMKPSVANASNRCNDAAQRCKRISPLRFLPRCRGAHCAPADILPTFDFPIPYLPPRGRGTARRRWKEFVPLTRLRKTGESSSADDGTRSARPRGLGGDFDLPRSKVATRFAPFRLGYSASLSRQQGALGFDPPLNPLGTP